MLKPLKKTNKNIRERHFFSQSIISLITSNLQSKLSKEIKWHAQEINKSLIITESEDALSASGKAQEKEK